MTRPGIAGRFAFATLGAAASGLALFGRGSLRPGSLGFWALIDGAFAAGVFALLRSRRTELAALLALGFGCVRYAFVTEGRWTGLPAGLGLAGGVFLCGALFHLLAEEGLRLGKALVAATTVAGVYVAVAPLAELQRLISIEAVARLIDLAYLGLGVGLGVGLGIEVRELLPGGAPRPGEESGPG